MIPGTAERVHGDLAGKGWALATSKQLGLPGEADVIGALSPALAADPREAGKHHARDIVVYDTDDSPVISESGSIAHVDGTDDFSRFRLLDAPWGVSVAAAFLSLVPPLLARPSGRMSADYFRYAPGVGAEAHQDEFGDLVAIWVLDRNGTGAESFLTDSYGRDVLRGALAPGQVLVFRDEMFMHGITPLASGHRDVLIFITLKDGGVEL